MAPLPCALVHEKELDVKNYNVTLKFRDGSEKTYHVLALDIFIAWHQAVSLYGGVVCD